MCKSLCRDSIVIVIPAGKGPRVLRSG
jgi:hypothetical protein